MSLVIQVLFNVMCLCGNTLINRWRWQKKVDSANRQFGSQRWRISCCSCRCSAKFSSAFFSLKRRELISFSDVWCDLVILSHSTLLSHLERWCSVQPFLQSIIWSGCLEHPSGSPYFPLQWWWWRYQKSMRQALYINARQSAFNFESFCWTFKRLLAFNRQARPSKRTTRHRDDEIFFFFKLLLIT